MCYPGIQVSFWFIFQHGCRVWHQDTCSGSSEAPQHGVWNLQMDRLWWGVSTETCRFCISGWSWANCNALNVFFCFFLKKRKVFLKPVIRLTLFWIQPLDLGNCSLSVHIFTLNEDGPSLLVLEEDEELTAASHWMLPAGNTAEEDTLK